MRVLVTGGAGFIGSRVCEKLLAAGHGVCVFDRFASYFPERSEGCFWSARLARMAERSQESGASLHVVSGDTRHASEVFRTILEFDPDRILHLAAVSGAVPAGKHATEAVGSAVDGTLALLEAVRDNGIDRFVYVSSSMVYGDFQDGAVSEDHPTRPVDVYGASKLAGEVVTKGYCKHFQISWVVVRPSAVYGSGDSNYRVVQVFVERARAGETLVLRGGDSVKLDFTYVDDIADGLMLALTEQNALYGTFNMTRGQGRSLGELCRILRRYFPELTVREDPPRKNTPIRGTLDCSKARDLLGFSPRFSLEDGIAAYLEQEGAVDAGSAV